MRKLLIGLAFLLALLFAIPATLIATGTIDATSLRMVLNVMTGLGGPGADVDTVQGRYQVPDGFSISLYANELPQARFMQVTPTGDLLLSRPHAGDVLLLARDEDGDGQSDSRRTVIDGLKRPLGLDLHQGWLYIAESHRLIRLPFDSETGQTTGDYEVLVDDLTDNGNHWSKTLRIGPDGALYLAQGSTCNVCNEEDARRATVMRFDRDGNGGEIIATGLRNSVGMDWAPWNGELYATDNGRDLLGDDFPPCELNLIRPGSFYGWPYFNGNNIPDPDMGDDPAATDAQPVAPAHNFRAHNAPLGIRFLNSSDLPADFARSALVALHGSWNRSDPDGYKVVSLHFTDEGIVERDFLWGFLQEGDISGRPVDIAQGPDGAIYVSDDYAGAIYRIVYGRGGSSSLALPQSDSQVRTTQNDTPLWVESEDLTALAASGKAKYDELGCAACHEQGANPKSLDHLVAQRDYAKVLQSLQAPQSPMPAYSLSAAEQRALAVYVVHPELRPGQR